MQWRVPQLVPVVKFVAAGGLVVAALLTAADTVGYAVAVLAAVALVASGVRDLALPVRLAADHDGLTVLVGLRTHREIPWRDVERVRVDDRRRLLGRSTLLEIDTGATLHFLSRRELGTAPAEVARELGVLRTGR